MKKIIKKIMETRVFKITEAIVLFPLQLTAFVFVNTIGIVWYHLERIGEEKK